MTVAHAVALIDKIQMGVDMDNMHRLLIVEGSDAGNMDRMVAAQTNRQGARRQYLAHPVFGVLQAFYGVRVDHIGVANINDADFVLGQIDHVVFVVVGAGMAEGEQGRCLADGARAEAGAGPVLGAHIKGDTHDRHIGVDGVPIQAGWLLAECAKPDKRQI